jgi:serine/threonine-protein kinase SRPK3
MRSLPTYEWQEDIENLENYRNGGFHPIQLNESLVDGRYSIVYKLGYGTFWQETLCLAQDPYSQCITLKD